MTECLKLMIHRNGAQEERCQVDAEFISVMVFLYTDQIRQSRGVDSEEASKHSFCFFIWIKSAKSFKC